MAGSRRRRQQRQRQQQQGQGDQATTGSNNNGSNNNVNVVARLPAELLAEIQNQLIFLDRVAFALVCRDSGTPMKPDAHPWLVVSTAAADSTATLVSVADRASRDVPTCDPAMRGHVVLGSSLGWLVTADAKGALRLANPVTGAQADLPSIATMPSLFFRTGQWFGVNMETLSQVRFAGAAPPPGYVDQIWRTPPLPKSLTLRAEQMRQCLYRKVVLSASPRAGSYAAMLVLRPAFGAIPAFATSEDDPNWRPAPSRDGIEDAVCHDGRFYSLTYSGVVEAWDRDADTGTLKSTVVAPKLEVVSPAAADNSTDDDDDGGGVYNFLVI
ncbi:hypothetical protein QOZ80_4AG0326870 [Eleusine coracana subsp. coracana]|nr:hypothetical protein QOZ80_4AG0326870 [Eleusine coracana subsp. coracana]